MTIKKNIEVSVNSETRKVFFEDNFLGLTGENLQGYIVFDFQDKFVKGVPRVEVVQDSNKYIITEIETDNENGTYNLPIKSSLLTTSNVQMQLVITEKQEENSIPIFKSKTFYMYVAESINAETTIPEEYTAWIDTANAKITEINEKLEDVDTALNNVDVAIEKTNQAVEQANNLDINAEKVEKTTTIEITKKDGTTKSVQILDGIDLQFVWQGTSLGIKTSNQEEYTFVDLQGVQGVPGPQGEPFRIKKTYPSVSAMQADFENMNVGDYVMIASSVEEEDNAKMYYRAENEWVYITDFSGAMGIVGPVGATPNIQIGTVTSGDTPSVTRSGTDEEPVLNFVLQKGDKGDIGNTGATGNGIESITKTSTNGLVDTYTITYTDGTTTTFDITNGEDGEVTQEQYDELQERVEELEGNQLTDEVSGTDITIDDAYNTKLKRLEIDSTETKQVTTTGKNLFKNIATSLAKYEITMNNDGKEISISGKNNSSEYYPSFIFYADGTTLSIDWYPTTSQINSSKGYFNDNSVANTLTIIPDGTFTSNIRIFIGRETSVDLVDIYESDLSNIIRNYAVNSKKINFIAFGFKPNQTVNANFKVQLEENSTATEYEPYTNGASPNPSYPQSVKTMIGIRNLFNTLTPGGVDSRVSYEIIDNNNVVIKTNSTNSQQYKRAHFIINDLKENTNYIFNANILNSNTNLTRNWLYIKTINGKTIYNNVYISENIVKFNSGENTSLDFALYVIGVDSANDNIATWSNIQLVEGTEEKPYVPYGSNYMLLDKVGENLFSSEIELGSINNTTGENVTSTTVVRTKDYIKVLPSTTYTLSNNLGYHYYVYQYDRNNTFISYSSQTNGKPYTFTTTATTKYIKLRANATATQNDTSVKYQLEEGSTATDYEPYQSNQYPISLGNQELLNKNSYVDKVIVDESTGKSYIEKVWGKVVLDGSEDWATANSTYHRYYLLKSNVAKQGEILSNCFTRYPNLQDQNRELYAKIDTGYYNANRIYIQDYTAFSTLAEFKTWLSTQYENGNPVVIYYALAEPELIPIDNPNIKLFNGTNHLSNSEEANMNIIYVKNINIIINKLTNAIIELGGES